MTALATSSERLVIFTYALRAILGGFALIGAACAPASAPSQITSVGVTLEDPWVATTSGGATVGAGYVVINNPGPDLERLLSAESPRAARVELHEMSMTDDGVMQMRAVSAVDIPAGGSAALAPGGLHIMMFDITAPIAEGEEIPITLHFERQGDVDAVFIARPRTASMNH